MLYTYIIKTYMNKIQDLTEQVDYIRELIGQSKSEDIPKYYTTDDELTKILS